MARQWVYDMCRREWQRILSQLGLPTTANRAFVVGTMPRLMGWVILLLWNGICSLQLAGNSRQGTKSPLASLWLEEWLLHTLPLSDLMVRARSCIHRREPLVNFWFVQECWWLLLCCQRTYYSIWSLLNWFSDAPRLTRQDSFHTPVNALFISTLVGPSWKRKNLPSSPAPLLLAQNRMIRSRVFHIWATATMLLYLQRGRCHIVRRQGIDMKVLSPSRVRSEEAR